ncbi:hypothetical protein [Enterococcus mundtii]|uniref:Lipoprotein n=1 Tax=Enterococcus mundtii TaxID=53346 RepID=A0A1V2UF14_ENTMU|nr:hypothetical protein [Enterococcus mundtii]ONN41873.1 hypothetical protein BTN92_11995 [Enterococcus mundtii]OTP20007.1 hypothetical protein A5802_003235 [Enterococcus mundtii]OTP22141.1 hypothetical protein A5802_003146 [Enterococcus mundtii]
MKKLMLVFTSFIAMLVILGGCGSEKNKQARQDVGVLKPGTEWKEEVGGLVHNLKIIDDTTWEYSETVWHPEQVQITVEKLKDYKGIERYKIIDSGGIDLFIGKTALIVPYNKNGLETFKFIPTNENEHRDKNEILKEYSTKSGYKLQKTSE